MLHVTPSEVNSALDQAASEFVALRPRLFSVAYQIVRCPSEAEDIVQEVWLRWQTTDRTVVADPPAFLARTSARLAINVVRSARSRREAPAASWLSEPVDTGASPELRAERGEALGLAVRLLLEKLTPQERAALILREAFDYGYGQIASILWLGEANTRQIVSRARKHLGGPRRRSVSAYAHRRLLEAMLVALRTGDLADLETLLAADAVRCSNGAVVRPAA